MHAFSSFLTRVFDVLVTPFSGNPTVALAVLSVVCGVLAVLAFRAVSDQAGIRRSRELLTARLLEMQIYRDDVVLILRALGGALWSNVVYLRRSLPAVLLLVLLVGVFAIQLDARFGARPLRAGDDAVVTVRYEKASDPARASLALAPEGAEVAAGPVRALAGREVSWRVRVTDGNDAALRFYTPHDAVIRIPLEGGDGASVVGRTRGTGFLDALLHPGLPQLPRGAAVERIDVQYAPRTTSLFGFGVAWWIAFLVWSLAGAMTAKFVFRVAV